MLSYTICVYIHIYIYIIHVLCPFAVERASSEAPHSSPYIYIYIYMCLYMSSIPRSVCMCVYIYIYIHTYTVWSSSWLLLMTRARQYRSHAFKPEPWHAIHEQSNNNIILFIFGITTLTCSSIPFTDLACNVITYLCSWCAIKCVPSRTTNLVNSCQDGLSHNKGRFERHILMCFSFARSEHFSNVVPRAPEGAGFPGNTRVLPLRTMVTT